MNLALHVGDLRERVLSNRALLGQKVGRVQFMDQIHSDGIEVVNSFSEIDPVCDALITTTPGLPIAVLVADCIPLLLSSKSVVAAVHVGRRGLVNEIALKVIDQMRNLGAQAIHAQLGPSICGTCYEVSDEIAKSVLESHPQAFSLTRDSKPALDLQRGLEADLIATGVTCEISPICSLEDSEFFSYRRDKVTGRNAGIIWL